jgi:hypothetical protein
MVYISMTIIRDMKVSSKTIWSTVKVKYYSRMATISKVNFNKITEKTEEYTLMQPVIKILKFYQKMVNS